VLKSLGQPVSELLVQRYGQREVRKCRHGLNPAPSRSRLGNGMRTPSRAREEAGTRAVSFGHRNLGPSQEARVQVPRHELGMFQNALVQRNRAVHAFDDK
jgi:hypothetical protein